MPEKKDNDLLSELPCPHFFHIGCVDKWLKITALCPLCKFEIGVSNEDSSTEDSNQQQSWGIQGKLNLKTKLVVYTYQSNGRKCAISKIQNYLSFSI